MPFLILKPLLWVGGSILGWEWLTSSETVSTWFSKKVIGLAVLAGVAFWIFNKLKKA